MEWYLTGRLQIDYQFYSSDLRITFPASEANTAAGRKIAGSSPFKQRKLLRWILAYSWMTEEGVRRKFSYFFLKACGEKAKRLATVENHSTISVHLLNWAESGCLLLTISSGKEPSDHYTSYGKRILPVIAWALGAATKMRKVRITSAEYRLFEIWQNPI